MVTLCIEFLNKIQDIIDKDTEEWIRIFRNNIKDLQGMVDKQN